MQRNSKVWPIHMENELLETAWAGPKDVAAMIKELREI